MKNLMRSLLGLAVATAAVAGCAKIESETAPFVDSGLTMTVEFTSVMGTGAESKTGMERVAIDGTDVKYNPYWTVGDQIGVFVRCGQDDVNVNLASEALTTQTADTLHKATFSVKKVSVPQNDTMYDFYVYYPYSNMVGSTYRDVRVMIPTVQHPANDSYDPKADILSGYPGSQLVTHTSYSTKTVSFDKLAFTRRSSVVVLMPQVGSGLPDGVTSDSIVDEIQLTFSKPVAGVASLDIIDSTAFTLEDIGGSRTVTLKYAAGSHKLGDPIWVSVAPVQQVSGLSFAFGLGDGRYLCADADWGGKPQTFKQGKVKKYNVPISDTYFSQKQELREYYQLVDTQQEDWCGRYLIVGEKNGTYYACNQQISGDWGQCDVVTVNDGLIACSDATITCEFSIEPGLAAGKYSILDYSGRYLSASDTKYQVTDNPKAEDTDFTIAPGLIQRGSAARQLRLNSSYKGMKFYDIESVSPVALYRLHTAFVGTEIEIEPVPDQIVGHQASDSHCFDVTIRNAGQTVPAVTADGYVVTAASIVNKLGDIYTVTYTVGSNTGLYARSGSVTVQCGEKSRDVTVTQGYNEYGIRIFYRVDSIDDVVPGRYVIAASTSTLTAYIPSFKPAGNPMVATEGYNPYDDTVRAENDSTIAWEFTGSLQQMTVKNSIGNYLYCTASENLAKIGGTADSWDIQCHSSGTANNLFQFRENNNNRYLGVYKNQDWRSYTDVNASAFVAADGSSKIQLYKLPYYYIRFLVGLNDSSNQIGESTELSSVVRVGSEYVNGFTSNCVNAYYNNKGGVKLGKTNSSGALEFEVSDQFRNSIGKIFVKSSTYGTDPGQLRLYVNGESTCVAEFTPGQDFVYTFPSPLTISYVKLATSSKRAYVSEIILDPR